MSIIEDVDLEEWQREMTVVACGAGESEFGQECSVLLQRAKELAGEKLGTVYELKGDRSCCISKVCRQRKIQKDAQAKSALNGFGHEKAFRAHPDASMFYRDMRPRDRS